MPLVKGDRTDQEEKPRGRIRNTKKLLVAAALIMSVLLIASSFVTALLIPREAFRPALGNQPAGEASGRALAYLAHHFFGNIFGSVYDISTILILWVAGASAMAGLLNIIPRYLPRYGMAPSWTRAMRPLVLILTIIAFGVSLIFKADVNAQGGAYATGVLVLMSSAAVAVTISALRRKENGWTAAFALISLVFAYTTVVNVIERPDGIKIAGFFIALIMLFQCYRALRAPLNYEWTVSRSMRQHNVSWTMRPKPGRSGSSPIILRRAIPKSTGAKWPNSARIIIFRVMIRFYFLKSKCVTLRNLWMS